ncbi:hypothetical protein [Rheinheimera hassiensis]|uniref:hypothetical protein n=1 Tax=Rheinheimera hassiensis TaxID=1193627 RepID=UPI001F05FA55|nr:hypothetical protein [Rheinheimera hassiensis]
MSAIMVDSYLQKENDVIDYLRLFNGNNQDVASNRRLGFLIDGLKNNTVFFIYNSFSQRVGYLLYAKITIESLWQSYKYNRDILHSFEWVEGDIYWIRDVYIAHGFFDLSARKCIRQGLKDKFLYINFSSNVHILKNSKKIDLNKKSYNLVSELSDDLRRFNLNE